MSAQGLDVSQLPTLRVQTQGHRLAVMMPLDSICSYLRSCKRGERVFYKDVVDFLTSLQPSTCASYLSMHAEGLYHALLAKDSVAYVPPAFILAEKAEQPSGVRLSVCGLYM